MAIFKTGDITQEKVEGLVCSGNPHLNMSGGINGTLLANGGAPLQVELHSYLKSNSLNYVDPGFVIEIGPSPFHFRSIVYCVAIDGFYDSSTDLVIKTLTNALTLLNNKKCDSIAIPALATGYGHLSKKDFGKALKITLNNNNWHFKTINIVLKNQDDLALVKDGYNTI